MLLETVWREPDNKVRVFFLPFLEGGGNCIALPRPDRPWCLLNLESREFGALAFTKVGLLLKLPSSLSTRVVLNGLFVVDPFSEMLWLRDVLLWALTKGPTLTGLSFLFFFLLSLDSFFPTFKYKRSPVSSVVGAFQLALTGLVYSIWGDVSVCIELLPSCLYTYLAFIRRGFNVVPYTIDQSISTATSSI